MLDEEIISAQSCNEAIFHRIVDKGASSEVIPTKTGRSDGNYTNVWLITGQKGNFEEMRSSYISECNKMGKELDYLIAHYRIVGNRKNIIEASEKLKKDLLDTTSLQSLGLALSGTSEKRSRVALKDVQQHLIRVSDSIAKFHGNLVSQRDDSHLLNVSKWMNYIKDKSDAQEKIAGLLRDRDLTACLENLHSELFKTLEELMRDVTVELSTMERNSVNTWLTSEKMGASQDTNDFEQWYMKYTLHVSSFQAPASTAVTWSAQEVENFKQRCADHKEACEGMYEELRLLIGHYEHIGGDDEVILASRFLRERLHAPTKTIEWLLSGNSHNMELVRESLISGVNRLGWLHFAAYRFQQSLYHQKHAFYFNNVEKWVADLWIGWRKLIILIRENKLTKCRQDMEKMLKSLALTMAEIVADLKTFRTGALPSFLADLKERDTGQYTNITTIATFFSSVTATTLQISYSSSLPFSELLAVINLFWFLSLVFSVSAGVNSLVGLMWRKSPIYDTNPPPDLVRLWLEKAPMVFLIIAALIFIVGLNLLAFVPPQRPFEAFTTVAFTAAHILGLLMVIYWFFLESEQKYVVAKWLLHPLQQYNRDLELQRDIWWALGNDRNVGRLSYEMGPWIDKTRDKPYPVSRAIRRLSLLILMCWSRVKRLPSVFMAILSGFKHIPSGFKHIPSGFKHIPSTFKNIPAAFANFFSALRNLPSALNNLVAIRNHNRTTDTEAAEPTSSRKGKEGFQGAKEDFRKALEHKFEHSEIVREIMITIGNWENPYVQDSEYWLKRLRSLLWGYADLTKNLDEKGGLIEERKKMVESSASSGSPEYLLAGREGEPIWKTRPLEMYYRPRPTDVQKAAVSELMCL